MRILVLSLEPVRLDKPSALDRVLRRLAGRGYDVQVATAGGDSADAIVHGVRLTALGEYPPIVPREDKLASVLHHNTKLLSFVGTQLCDASQAVIHAHGWEVAWTATAARALYGVPIVRSNARDDPLDGLDPKEREVAEEALAWLDRDASERVSLPKTLLGVPAAARRAAAAYARAAALRSPPVRLRDRHYSDPPETAADRPAYG